MLSSDHNRVYRICPFRDQYLAAALRHAAIYEYAPDAWTGEVPGIVVAWATGHTEAECRERLTGMLTLAVDVQCVMGRANELPVFDGLRPNEHFTDN